MLAKIPKPIFTVWCKAHVAFSLTLVLCAFCIQIFAQNSGSSNVLPLGKRFIPARDIIFFDDFYGCDTGKVPKNWEIGKLNNWRRFDTSSEGAKVTLIRNRIALRLPDGYMEFVTPVIKQFVCDTCYQTIEFNYLHHDDTDKVTLHINYGMGTTAWENGCCAINKDGVVNVGFLNSENNSAVVNHEYTKYNYPGKYNSEEWHHFAASFYKKKMTLFIDGHRIFQDRNINLYPRRFVFMDPFYIANIRIAQYDNEASGKATSSSAELSTKSIYFEVARDIVLPEYTTYLKHLAEWLIHNPKRSIDINGYCDVDGAETINENLSLARATAVKNRIVTLGAPASQIATKGMGATKTFDEHETPEGKAKNRMVNFTVR